MSGDQSTLAPPLRRRLILLRHSETASPPGVLLGSRVDLGCSDRGRVLAANAGARLRRYPIAAVVCSPLRRARETAALAFPEALIAIDERLAEQDFGELTSLTWEEAKARFGDEARAWREGLGPPPGGEEHAAVLNRVLAATGDALERGARRGDVGEIVLVTHSTPIRALIALSRGWTAADWRRIRVGYAQPRIVRVALLDRRGIDAPRHWRAGATATEPSLASEGGCLATVADAAIEGGRLTSAANLTAP